MSAIVEMGRRWQRAWGTHSVGDSFGRLTDEIERLEKENFALAANQCKAGYSGERGDHMCRLLDALWAVDRQLPDADMCFDADNSLRDIVRAAITKATGDGDTPLVIWDQVIR